MRVCVTVLTMRGLLLCVVYLLSVLLSARAAKSYAKAICERHPIHTTAQQTKGNNGFRIYIEGVPTEGKYRAGESYTVTLNGTLERGKEDDDGSRHKRKLVSFLGFMLVAVKKGAANETYTLGTFDTKKFHGRARNLADDKTCDHDLMSHHYLIKKNNIKMTWIAPETGSGCVEFRATVIEDSDLWYKDEDGLTTMLCEEMTQRDSVDIVAADSPSLLQEDECCACGHAKYVLDFQGLWSRQTHPKDFPSGDIAYLLHWSNIVGASHSNDYRIWEYGQYATQAVKEVCEFGSSRALQIDMKRNSKKIRTVVKTNSLWGPVKITQSVDALFTVNKKKHLLSLLTMVGPSPDWCLGISALDMCRKNCTWLDKMEIPLYPWDAGTDNGISYMSANQETNPPGRITAITNTNPNNPDSPFFGREPIKPLAMLTIRKNDEWCTNDNGEYTSAELSPSTDELVSIMKKKMMKQKKMQLEKCATSQWSDWSKCSCTSGLRSRRRMLKMPGITESMCSERLSEKEACSTAKCLKNSKRRKINTSFKFRHDTASGPYSMCSVTPWSEWSPCSRTCGLGMKERWRMFLHRSQKTDDCGIHLQEKDLCRGAMPDCSMADRLKNYTAICSEKADAGPCRGTFVRWFYNSTIQKCQIFNYGGCRGNENKFDTQDDCVELCAEHMTEVHRKAEMQRKQTMLKQQEMQKQEMMRKQQMMQKQQMESEIFKQSLSDMDIKTLMMKKKMMQQSANSKLEKEFAMEIKKKIKALRILKKKKKMKKWRLKHKNSPQHRDGPTVDCMVTPWSKWSQCPVTCGKGVIMKTRMIKVHPKNGGRRCPHKLVKKKKCRPGKKCPINCKMGPFGDWTPCSKTCGKRSVQTRWRRIIQKPRHGGMSCPRRREKRFCSVPMCTTSKLEQDMLRFMMYHHHYN
ncbi:spondin-1-like [Gigantopelta aegis]|uniref:spondin-1-like n=1 Tax=Gigantopelta aegis TaxID=1735272 RepID=UPI001B888303|nr:spondin-1-like [Gigantopelta aegis]